LGLLRITKECISDRNRTLDLILEEMLTVPTIVVYYEILSAVMLKSIVLDPE